MKLTFPWSTSFLAGLSIFLLAFPVFVYGYVFFSSLVDFPFYDDFFWYNKLIIQAKGQPLSTQLSLLVQQHSDHRLIFLKGVALVLASLGPFDFRWPILLTNVLFLLFSTHLVIHIYRITRAWLFAVPCLFILFQFQPYTVAFSYGPQTLGILLFVYFAFINYMNSPRTILKKRALFQHRGFTLVSRYIPTFVLPAGTYQAFVVDENAGTRKRLDKPIHIVQGNISVK